MAETHKILTFDVLTNESTERQMNSQELLEHEKVKSFFLDFESTLEAQIASKQSAVAKLAALGLTEEEIAAL